MSDVQEESSDRQVDEATKLNAKATALDETQPPAAAVKFGWIQGVLVSTWMMQLPLLSIKTEGIWRALR